MKVAPRILDVTSTLEGEKVAMSIDQSALAHIMGVLTDLYSDPELAVIREYSTNALDSHIEAGVTRPIEVQLPTALSPFLKIRDYGVGLDAADIRDIYSRYGTSTKRDSNDVVGMLGLGCKSALTYADQFTLSGTKNGKTVQVSISRDEDGAGSMTLVSVYEDDTPSGVEVVIPAKRGHDFEDKANDFFRFWKPGTVLVNGKQPKRIGGLWIADDLLLTDEVDEDKIVMGNVAYPMPSDRYGRQHIVAFVGIGEVQFTPSREALQMTSGTKATIDEIRKRDQVEREAALMKLVAEAESHSDAVRVANKARFMGLKGTPVYKGEDVPTEFAFERKVKRPVVVGGVVQTDDKGKPQIEDATESMQAVVVQAVKPNYGRQKGWSESRKVPSSMIDATWVVGYDSDAFTPYKRQKLEVYCEDNKITRTNDPKSEGVVTFIFCRELPEAHAHWIDPANVLAWEDIKAIKIEKEKRTDRLDGRPTGSYDAFVAGQSEGGIPADDLSRTDLFWAQSSGRNSWGSHTQPHGLKQLLKLHPDATVVTIGGNRVAKFERDFPMAQNITTYLNAKANEWQSKVSADDRLAYVVQHDYYKGGLFKGLDASKVDDPEIKSLIGHANRSLATLESEVAFWTNHRRLDTGEASKRLEALYGSYALLQHLTRLSNCDKNDLYIYLNAAYAARKEV